MVRMIKRLTDVTPEKFYDHLAAEYDRLTGFDRRFAVEQPWFQTIRNRYQLDTALDAGCGSGFHSILLGRLGVKVVASDISENMLSQTKRNAKAYGVRLKTIKAKFHDLKTAVPHKFDSVFCLGNSCAHLLTKEELLRSLSSFYGVLKGYGVLVLQILNYHRILALRERIQHIRESDGKMLIRFYDYENKLIRFNILTIDKNQKGLPYDIQSVMLRPWKFKEIVRVLHRMGFVNVNIYGNMALDRYNSISSKDAVVIAQRKPS